MTPVQSGLERLGESDAFLEEIQRLAEHAPEDRTQELRAIATRGSGLD